MARKFFTSRAKRKIFSHHVLGDVDREVSRTRISVTFSQYTSGVLQRL
ncbi:DUF1661 domain-containing protein [Porphyromonas gulae]|nr:DUF1661 domain-containing protein [Porphyromonas gulae]